MISAQKDQLLEIGSRARLGKPIICRGLSVPCDKSRTFRLMKFEQIFSLQCQTEQAVSQEAHHKLFFTNDFPSSPLDTMKRQSCGLREWWSRTGSNRRHPACKAGALPAELRPLIVSSSRCRGDSTILADCEVVGLGGLEPPTSRLSSARSNQLSYKP